MTEEIQGARKKPNVTPQSTTDADLAYWMGQVDARLSQILEKVNRQDQNAKDMDVWRDSVTNRLQAAETCQEQINKRLEKIETLMENVKPDTFVTHTWIREKLILPLAIGFALWVLYTILPKLIQILPQL